MALRIEPATLDDGEVFTQISLKAFENDMMNSTLFPDPMTPEILQGFADWRVERYRARMPKGVWLKAIDESTGEIIGLSGWVAPQPKEEKKPEAEDAPKPPRWDGMPDYINTSYFDKLVDNIEKGKKEIGLADRTDYWYLGNLAVHPDHWGKGVAGKMLEYALREFVDRDGADAFLESTPAAKKTYARYGFEEKGIVASLEGQYITTLMIRPAHSNVKDAEVNGTS